ncbi:adhesion G-protein coupled receptor G2 [Gastrophryne carolinensis]
MLLVDSTSTRYNGCRITREKDDSRQLSQWWSKSQLAVSGNSKAVFTEPCKQVMMLDINVSDLDQFTVCTYMKLDSLNPWTAFIYRPLSSPLDNYNMALLGDSRSINISMFGTQIDIPRPLNLYTWYEMCIQWNAKITRMNFYIDGKIEQASKVSGTTLPGKANVRLGCLESIDKNASTAIGLIGELYMFRMRNTADSSLINKCNDGDIIKWNTADWVYSPTVVQEDTTLNCAKKLPSDPGSVAVSTSSITLPVKSSTSVTELTLDTSISILQSSSSSVTTKGNEDLSHTTNAENSYVTANIRNTTIVSDGKETTVTANTTYVTTGSNTMTGNEDLSHTTNAENTYVTANIRNTTIVSDGKETTVTANTTYVTTGSNTMTGNEDLSHTTNAENTYVTANIRNTTIVSDGKETTVTANTTYVTTGSNTMTESINNTTITVSSAMASGMTTELINGTTINVSSAMPSDMTTELGNDTTINASSPLPSDMTTDMSCAYNESLDVQDLLEISLEEVKRIGELMALMKRNSYGWKEVECHQQQRERRDVVYTSNPYCYPSNVKPPTGGSIGGNGGSDGTETRASTPGIQTPDKSSVFTTSTKDVHTETDTTSDKHLNNTTTTLWSIGVNTTINTGNTFTFNSSSKTTVYSGPTMTVNRSSITTVISGPTTSVRSGATTAQKMTETTAFESISTELFISTSTTQKSNISAIVDKLQELLNSTNLNASMVDSIVSQLEDLLAGEINSEAAAKLVGILNTFLNLNQSLITPVSTRLIKIVDKIGLQLTFPGQSVNVTSQYLALAVGKANASTFTGTSFGVESDMQVSLGSSAPLNSDGCVTLPASLLNDLSPENKAIASRVQFNYFAKTSFFLDSSLTVNESVVSNVISSSVANLSISNLKENVTVTLKASALQGVGLLKCVFWDFTKNSGKGGWSTHGCTMKKTTQSNNATVCQCNHLTSFAILLDMTPNQGISPEDNLILTFITYIGCGLSAIFLSVTLVTYIAFEKIRRDYPSKILIQLCAALICLNLTFLMNPWIAMYNDVPGLCISVAAFLHYFVLVSITWMGLEAFHMYLALVKVFNTYVRKYILKFCIIGWGAPAVVVAIILAVNKDLYRLQITSPYPNGAADYFCWMDDIIYWITVVGYFCMIFTMNVSMFIVVLVQLCRIKKQKQLGFQRKTTLQDMRSVAGITFLLGITWGLGFFSFGPGKVVIQYLFTICNTLQGFFIFFFYCVAKENVRKQWRRYLCCGKFRLAENSDWSKTATNKLRQQTSKQGVSSSSSNSIQSTSNSNSTTLLVANEYSVHLNGNGHVFKEKNGVSFMSQNGAVPLQEFPGRPHANMGNAHQTSLRRTSKRGSVHFVDQI